jgi:hypothetical protein
MLPAAARPVHAVDGEPADASNSFRLLRLAAFGISADWDGGGAKVRTKYHGPGRSRPFQRGAIPISLLTRARQVSENGDRRRSIAILGNGNIHFGRRKSDLPPGRLRSANKQFFAAKQLAVGVERSIGARPVLTHECLEERFGDSFSARVGPRGPRWLFTSAQQRGEK